MLFSWLDHADLTGVHIMATLVGMLLSVYASHMMWQDEESNRDRWLIRYGRRVMYPLLALAFLWALDYSHVKGWMPWPPNVAIIVAIDFIIAMRILALRQRQREIAQRGWTRPMGVDRGHGF